MDGHRNPLYTSEGRKLVAQHPASIVRADAKKETVLRGPSHNLSP